MDGSLTLAEKEALGVEIMGRRRFTNDSRLSIISKK
jgi:hypothetical protein